MTMMKSRASLPAYVSGASHNKAVLTQIPSEIRMLFFDSSPVCHLLALQCHTLCPQRMSSSAIPFSFFHYLAFGLTFACLIYPLTPVPASAPPMQGKARRPRLTT